MMQHQKIAVGVQLPACPPLGLNRALVYAARLMRLDSVWVYDHLQTFLPTVLWDKDFSWLATQIPSPHSNYSYDLLLAYLARDAGNLPLGVAATHPAGHHPVLIAKGMVTLSHMTRRAPILGIGSGERQNIVPYGLDPSRPAERLEEALKIIRLCFSRQDPFRFEGKHYHLERAVMGLQSPKGRRPRIWVSAYGPRMLQLAGRYGDGWLFVGVPSAEEYEPRLKLVCEVAHEAGRDPRAVTPAAFYFVMLASTEQEARALIETKLARFVSGLVVASAEDWRKVGARHPLGEEYKGYFEFLPERYDRRTIEEGLLHMPPELVGHGLLWGTPNRVADQLRACGEAGLRHTILFPLQAFLSPRAAIYSIFAIGKVARSLRGASG